MINQTVENIKTILEKKRPAKNCKDKIALHLVTWYFLIKNNCWPQEADARIILANSEIFSEIMTILNLTKDERNELKDQWDKKKTEELAKLNKAAQKKLLDEEAALQLAKDAENKRVLLEEEKEQKREQEQLTRKKCVEYYVEKFFVDNDTPRLYNDMPVLSITSQIFINMVTKIYKEIRGATLTKPNFREILNQTVQQLLKDLKTSNTKCLKELAFSVCANALVVVTSTSKKEKFLKEVALDLVAIADKKEDEENLVILYKYVCAIILFLQEQLSIDVAIEVKNDHSIVRAEETFAEENRVFCKYVSDAAKYQNKNPGDVIYSEGNDDDDDEEIILEEGVAGGETIVYINNSVFIVNNTTLFANKRYFGKLQNQPSKSSECDKSSKEAAKTACETFVFIATVYELPNFYEIQTNIFTILDVQLISVNSASKDIEEKDRERTYKIIPELIKKLLDLKKLLINLQKWDTKTNELLQKWFVDNFVSASTKITKSTKRGVAGSGDSNTDVTRNTSSESKRDSESDSKSEFTAPEPEALQWYDDLFPSIKPTPGLNVGNPSSDEILTAAQNRLSGEQSREAQLNAARIQKNKEEAAQTQQKIREEAAQTQQRKEKITLLKRKNQEEQNATQTPDEFLISDEAGRKLEVETKEKDGWYMSYFNNLDISTLPTDLQDAFDKHYIDTGVFAKPSHDSFGKITFPPPDDIFGGRRSYFDDISSKLWLGYD
jgi:hypothetical protein